MIQSMPRPLSTLRLRMHLHRTHHKRIWISICWNSVKGIRLVWKRLIRLVINTQRSGTIYHLFLLFQVLEIFRGINRILMEEMEELILITRDLILAIRALILAIRALIQTIRDLTKIIKALIQTIRDLIQTIKALIRITRVLILAIRALIQTIKALIQTIKALIQTIRDLTKIIKV